MSATATKIAFDKINRYASKAPNLDIASSDHLKTCRHCRANKLAELGAMIKGTKAATSVTIKKSHPGDRTEKLRELGKIIRGE